MERAILYEAASELIDDASVSLDAACPRPDAETLSEAEEDLDAFLFRDPAEMGGIKHFLRNHPGFQALLHYRLARALLRRSEAGGEAAAMYLRHRAHGRFGIDIHPAATIGHGAVIDHGFGTVVGATVALGDWAYILGGVVLGSRRIAGNAPGKRHPTIGNNVEIGAFSRVLGPITIGDGCFIGPHSVVTRDLPAGSRVTVHSNFQILGGSDDRQGGADEPKGLSILGVLPAWNRVLLRVRGGRSPTVSVGCWEEGSCLRLCVAEVEPEIFAVEAPQLEAAMHRIGAGRRPYLEVCGADNERVVFDLTALTTVGGRDAARAG